MPPRTIDVHDSRVRRIAPITPDMNDPNPSPSATRESNDNIPKGTRRVRVQTVNANRDVK